MTSERDDAGARRSEPRHARPPENSRLFALDTLVDVGHSVARAPAARPTLARPEVVGLPGFGGSGLTGLGTASPIAASPALGAPIGPAVTLRSDRWIVATLVLLSSALVALAAWVVTHPPTPIVVTTPVAPEPAPPAQVRIALHDATDDDGARTREPVTETPAPAEPSIDVAPPSANDPTPRQGVARPRRPDRTPSPPPRTDAPRAGEGDVSVECVLDPQRCATGKSRTKPETPTSADDDRPLTLGQPEIRAGIAPHKPAAKACAARHGGQPGEKVRVKLSIAGPTGAVISTSAEAPHQGTPLGNCVAAALKKASFAKFRKPVIGLVYAITL